MTPPRPRVTPPSTRRSGESQSLLEELINPQARAADPTVVIKEVEVVREVLVDPLPAPEQIPVRTAPETDSAKLTEAERADLLVCIDAIERAKAMAERSGFTIARAMRTIRDARLYRETHTDLESFIRDNWGYSRSYATRKIAAVEVADAMLPIGNIENEAQARPLVPVLRDHGADALHLVWMHAKEEVGDSAPTGRALEAAVAALGLAPVPAQADADGGSKAHAAAIRERTRSLSTRLGRPVSQTELVKHLLDVLADDDRLYEQLLVRLQADGE